MDLFLIAHKVRGEAAFDIAERQDCPECISDGHPNCLEVDCSECDGEGFWWIVSTSGHRAYPYWTLSMKECCLNETGESVLYHASDMPEGCPDHYPTRSSPKAESSGKSLLAKLGLIPKVVRRL